MTVEEHFLDLSTGRTRYLRAGDGPPLLLLHGMGIVSSADSWMLVHEALAQHFEVFALDLLGYGKGNRHVAEGPTFELTVDHIREFLDVLGIPRISIVGHSAGGWVAGLLAYESPDRVNDLVLQCSAGMNVQILDGILGQVQPDRARADAVARSFLSDPVSVDAERINRLSECIYEMGNQPGALNSLDPIIHQMSTPELRSRYLLQRRLPFIRSRTLVVWGEGDVMDPYPTWTNEYARLDGAMEHSSKPWVVPGSQFRLLPTGHTPHWERPDLLAEVLLGFLSR